MAWYTFAAHTKIESAKVNNNLSILKDTLYVYNDDLTATVPAVGGLYYTSVAYKTGTTRVYVDGLRQRLGTDYTESTPTTGEITIAGLVAGQDLIVDFQKNSSVI